MVYRLVNSRSPNCDARPADAKTDMLVLHYTGMATSDEAIARLCNPAAEVSAHYVIDRKGCVYALVPEDKRAWHAGVSFWAGQAGVNARSIGIELVNPGHEFGYQPFSDDQIASLTGLAGEILARHAIAPHNVVGHSDVAPARKSDPGELFPWERLARAGIGRWPAVRTSVSPRPAADLARYGYGLPPVCDVPQEAVVTAFQRHFRPRHIDGAWDDECGRLLAMLLAD